MKYFSMMALAAGAALATATPANAAIVIGVSVNGSPVSTVASGAGSANYNTTVGGYFFNVSGTGFPNLASPQLLTQSVNIQQQGGANAVIDVYITQTDQPTFTGGLLSTFTSNSQSGLNAELTSWYDAGNGLFGGTLLQTATFNGTSAQPRTASGENVIGTVPGMWSETVRYRLTFTGGNGSNFNGTVNLAAVPEPATWAMMMLGFGALGAMIRRRKTSTTARIRFA